MNANAKKSQFQARLENQKNQLERHGNFAEVVIRTTPEGTDMINFARLWEHVLVQADRQTRGYAAKNSREDFEQTRQDFQDAVDFMVTRLRSCIERHDLDLAGTNFISRVAQRYNISEKKRKEPSAPKLSTTKKEPKPEQPIEKPAAAPQTKPQAAAPAATENLEPVEE